MKLLLLCVLVAIASLGVIMGFAYTLAHLAERWSLETVIWLMILGGGAFLGTAVWFLLSGGAQ